MIGDEQISEEESTSMQKGQTQSMELSSKDFVRPLFSRLYSKRRRLDGRWYRPVPKTNLMDLNDDALATVILQLVGGKFPTIVRQRQLKNLFRAYPFVTTKERVFRTFHTHICTRIHTLDAIYPLNINEELRLAPLHALPENIAFLCSMLRASLRVVRFPSFKAVGVPNDEYQSSQLNKMKRLMIVLAQNCSELIEISFQDAGSADDYIGKLLLLRNPSLKKIQVDTPGPSFMSILAESECVIEDLNLLRVQTTTLPGLRKFLLRRGSSLQKLGVSMCLPLDPDFEPTPANKARYRRREKTFIEGLEKLTRTKMTSLRTLYIRPEKRAAWFKEFIKRFQMLAQADLIIGDSKVCYPAGTAANIQNIELPTARSNVLSMDELLLSDLPAGFNEYMRRVHEPETLSIMRSIFTYYYASGNNTQLEDSVKTALSMRGKSLKRLILETPIPRLHDFEVSLHAIKEILSIIEEKFGSLDQIEELRMPVNVVIYLARGFGYKMFFAKLSNLKVLYLVKPQMQPEAAVEVVMAMPMFLRGIATACPLLESIYISNAECTKMRLNDEKAHVAQALEKATIALNEYEEANSQVDVWTLQRQLVMWAREMLPI